MHSHPMARLTAISRERLIRRHLEDGETLKDLASQAGISLRTARKWKKRFEATGLDGLADLSSRPHRTRTSLDVEHPFEIRPVEEFNPLEPRVAAPLAHAWLRSSAPLPDDDRVHRCLLAYASDFALLDTALVPHGRSYWQGDLRMASIDHAMWFHRGFRADEWLLYAMDSPNASGSRGLVRGELFDRSGRLVASTVQEGMIRDLR